MVARGRKTLRRCTTCGREVVTAAKGCMTYVQGSGRARNARTWCGTLRVVDRERRVIRLRPSRDASDAQD